jgi:hypothetical protein
MIFCGCSEVQYYTAIQHSEQIISKKNYENYSNNLMAGILFTD